MSDDSKVYLGDSVYASYDGYHIWLTTENGYLDDPRNKIALDPHVVDALTDYIQRLARETDGQWAQRFLLQSTCIGIGIHLHRRCSRN